MKIFINGKKDAEKLSTQVTYTELEEYESDWSINFTCGILSSGAFFVIDEHKPYPGEPVGKEKYNSTTFKGPGERALRAASPFIYITPSLITSLALIPPTRPVFETMGLFEAVCVFDLLSSIFE